MHRLPKRSRKAYVEALYRREHGGQRSPEWHGSEYEVMIWMSAFEISMDEDISPWDALLLAVKRRAARVRWDDQIIQEILNEHRAKCDPESERYNVEYSATHNPEIPPGEVRQWTAESRNEERIMTRAAKMAVDAGVADAVVRRIELEGRMVTDAMIAGLDVLNLSPDDRMRALTTMHGKLAGLPADGPAEIEGFVAKEDDDEDRP